MDRFWAPNGPGRLLDINLTDPSAQWSIRDWRIDSFDESHIRAASSIASLRIGIFERNSSILVGVTPDVHGLPVTLDQFLPSKSIGSVTVRRSRSTILFSHSLIAASSIGKIDVTLIDPVATGEAFGIVADRIDSYVRRAGVASVSRKGLDAAQVADTESDYRVQLL